MNEISRNPDAGKLDTIAHDSSEIQGKAASLEITDDVEYAAAAELLTTIKALMARISRTMDPVISAAHAAHREALNAKKEHFRPLESAEETIKPKIASYIRKREDERKAEQRRLDEETRKKNLKHAEEKRIQDAIDLETAGQVEKADQLLDKPVEQPLAVGPQAPELPKIKGVFTKKTWHWRVIDPGKVPLTFMVADSIAINRHVRLHKDEVGIPGVEIYSKNIVAAGTGGK